MHQNPEAKGGDIAAHIVWRSMGAVPNDRALLPLVMRIHVAQMLRLTGIPVHSGELYQCKTCHGFLNPYCAMSQRPSKWRCAMCGRVQDLPPVPTDALKSSYTCAFESTPYRSFVFDRIVEPDKRESPKIVIALQRNVCEAMSERLMKSLMRNGLFKYALVVFDARFHIFDFKMKRWKVIPDVDGFVVPGTEQNLFASAEDVKNVLLHGFPPHSGIPNLKFVTQFMKELQNTKLVLFVGDLIEPAETIDFPCSIVILSEHSLSVLALKSWLDKPTTTLLQVNNDTELLASFLYDALQLPFISNCQITAIVNDRILLVKRRGPVTFEMVRQKGQIGGLYVDAQYVISFTNIHEQKVTRCITIRIPLSMDTNFYQSATFSKPFVNASAAASFIIEELIEQSERGESVSKQRVSLIELTSILPMRNEIWPRFAFAMITSILFASEDPQFRLGFLYMLRMSSNSTLLSELMSFDVVNEVLVPSRVDSSKAIARVNRNGIYTTSDDPEAVLETVSRLLAVEKYVLPVYQVSELPWSEQIATSESKYNEWFRNWEMSGVHFLEERRKAFAKQKT